jgi:hypothetical protein
VLVYPPDHPGTIPPQGGQGGDHEVSMICRTCQWFMSYSCINFILLHLQYSSPEKEYGMVILFNSVHFRLEKMLLRSMLKDGIGCAQ